LSQPYRDRDFHAFMACRLLSPMAAQVLSVAIAWQIYDMQRSTLALGLVGLCQFIPMFALTLPAGELADRTDPRRVNAAGLAAQAVCAGAFLVLAWTQTSRVGPFYALLILFGCARGFSGPSGQALLAFLVPAERLPRAIALNHSAFTVAVMLGPVLGGVLYVLSPTLAYGVSAGCLLASAGLTMGLGGRRVSVDSAQPRRLERVMEGIRFVRDRPIVLGAISLDLFAVLLGGTTALLPVFARDILQLGPIALGELRSAPAMGGAVVAIWLARYPLARHAGIKMFAAMALFGVATLVFGVSRDLALSLAALAVVGASSMLSVIVRASLINLATPDAMRGRVSAASTLFAGAANELGEFESGVTATWFGTVPAVLLGGLGTLGVAYLWTRLFPALLKVDKPSDAALRLS
jgi:MFS family permease